MARTLVFLTQPELAGGSSEPRTRSFRVVVERIAADTGEPVLREWYYMHFSKAKKIYRTLARELMVSRDTASYRICLNRAVNERWDNPIFSVEDPVREPETAGKGQNG